MFRCCVTGLYGACLHSTRRATDECRRCLPDWRIPFDSRLRSYVLDFKLKKNQSPVLIRLAGFRSRHLQIKLTQTDRITSSRFRRSPQSVFRGLKDILRAAGILLFEGGNRMSLARKAAIIMCAAFPL